MHFRVDVVVPAAEVEGTDARWAALVFFRRDTEIAENLPVHFYVAAVESRRKDLHPEKAIPAPPLEETKWLIDAGFVEEGCQRALDTLLGA